jgi:hypothetical protein
MERGGIRDPKTATAAMRNGWLCLAVCRAARKAVICSSKEVPDFATLHPGYMVSPARRAIIVLGWRL